MIIQCISILQHSKYLINKVHTQMIKVHGHTKKLPTRDSPCPNLINLPTNLEMWAIFLFLSRAHFFCFRMGASPVALSNTSTGNRH